MFVFFLYYWGMTEILNNAEAKEDLTAGDL